MTEEGHRYNHNDVGLDVGIILLDPWRPETLLNYLPQTPLQIYLINII